MSQWDAVVRRLSIKFAQDRAIAKQKQKDRRRERLEADPQLDLKQFPAWSVDIDGYNQGATHVLPLSGTPWVDER